MNIDLSGRTALVTGSTAGIGAAVAAALGTAGAEVVLNGRNAERVAETARRLGARGVAADVATPEGCDALIRQIPEADILVNNSGIFATQPVFEIPDEEWLRFFSVNVLSGIRLAATTLHEWQGGNGDESSSSAARQEYRRRRTWFTTA